MDRLTRRAVLAGASAAAATSSYPIFATRATEGANLGPFKLRSVKEFLAEAKAQELLAQERIDIVEQAIKLLNGFYAHLPLKRALYGINPLERLRLLQQRLPQLKGDPAFHTELRDIFASLRDIHTVYRLPEPYMNAHAWLPFKVEACLEHGRRKHIVSRVVDGFVHPTFRAGVEILSIDGIPVERAAELQGRHGSTPAAQHSLGLARLTYRALLWEPPPQEGMVLVHYEAGGQELDISIPWSISIQAGDCDRPSGSNNEIAQIQQFRKFLYAPLDPCTPFGVTERITTSEGVFGYIRVFSFDKDLMGGLDATKDDRYVAMFKDLVAPFVNTTKGLIIDVRDNGGGSTRASERVIQWVAPTRGQIEPGLLYFAATSETLRFAQLGTVSDLGPNGLKPWIPSIKQAVQSGASFSDAFEYTSNAACNESGRVVFPHPVIVVTSALSYSSAEFFAAGFQDHGGLILGIDETTGGGGAGVRTDEQLFDYFDADGDTSPPLKKLKKGGFSVAFRRTVRAGLGAGMEIEDAGVYRDRVYTMTRRDLLDGNRDLKREAARLLAQMT